MEDGKVDRRRCKERYNCTSCRISILLVVCTALVSVVWICRSSWPWHVSLWSTAPSQLPLADVKQSSDCSSERQLNDQASYDEYRRWLANLNIKLLSERDGAPNLQSRHPPRPREITIVTQTSADRWPQLEKMASSWGGALCVAVHVKTRAQIPALRNKMIWLHLHIEKQHHCRLHLQMVMEEGFKSETDALTASYPVNALRNVALGMAKTELVFLLDADFVPSPGLHEKLTADKKVYSDLVNRTINGGQLLVVPAFQVQPYAPPGVLLSTVKLVEEPIPRSMQELRERWLNGSITYFHSYFPMAHDVTSYSHFIHPLTTEPYHVQYRELYEPYFVAARALIPKFDERFRGFGKNKVAHAYNCAVQGFDFVVLPEVYVWEIPHPKTEFYHNFILEKQDPCQSNIMDVVYEEFKEDLQAKNPQSYAFQLYRDNFSSARNYRSHRVKMIYPDIDCTITR